MDQADLLKTTKKVLGRFCFDATTCFYVAYSINSLKNVHLCMNGPNSKV